LYDEKLIRKNTGFIMYKNNIHHEARHHQLPLQVRHEGGAKTTWSMEHGTLCYQARQED
jgi:hypothetical protein